MTVQEAAARTGWSPRMLRYLESAAIVAPRRSPAGYRLYDEVDVERLCALRALRRRFALALTDLAFARRLRDEPFLRRAVEAALGPPRTDWLDFEQSKQSRLLAA